MAKIKESVTPKEHTLQKLVKKLEKQIDNQLKVIQNKDKIIKKFEEKDELNNQLVGELESKLASRGEQLADNKNKLLEAILEINRLQTKVIELQDEKIGKLVPVTPVGV